MEFACKVAGAKLIMILGHSECGAIKGACNNVELGKLTGLLKKIKPSVKAAHSIKSTQDFHDLEFVEQLFKWEIPFTLIFTKSDKEKPAVVARNVKSFFEKLNEILPFLPQGFVTSAEKKTGVDEVLACIDQYNKLDAEGL